MARGEVRRGGEDLLERKERMRTGQRSGPSGDEIETWAFTKGVRNVWIARTKSCFTPRSRSRHS